MVHVSLVGAAAAVEAVGVGRRLPVGEVGAVPAAADATGHARLLDGLWGVEEIENREIPSDQNGKGESLIQLIKGVYLIHTGKFYLTNVPKNLLYVIIINLRLM